MGHSVNDHIPELHCSIKYSGLEEAITLLTEVGHGAWMVKLDLKHAYSIVPIHPDDRILLGMQWRGNVFLDICLPFGLRSAPKIFSAIADALLWIMLQRGVKKAIHYLDDFLIIGASFTDCHNQLEHALSTCDDLGVPVSLSKLEGPATTLTFLGINIDTIQGELSLPQEKLTRILQLLNKWTYRKACRKRELLSLIGELQHAASIVRPGRPFLRHLIDLSRIPKRLNHFVRLSSSAQADIMWWLCFMSQWNGRSFIPVDAPLRDVLITTDASGNWGCAAIWGNQWWQWRCTSSTFNWNIAAKELFSIVLAAATWGSQWWHAQVNCHCDNQAAANVVNKGSARDPLLAHLLQCLFFYATHFQFRFTAQHIPGHSNLAADALSRNQLTTFFSSLPQANPIPDRINPAAASLASHPSLTWTCSRWRYLFLNSLTREPTHQLISHP